MKYKIYAILQLVIMVLYLSRPIMPFVEYAIFKDYIAKNLCINRNNPKSKCNGKCHLAKQIKINNESDNAKEGNSSKKIQPKEVNEFINTCIIIPKSTEEDLTYSIENEPINKNCIISVIFVPPELVSIL